MSSYIKYPATGSVVKQLDFTATGWTIQRTLYMNATVGKPDGTAILATNGATVLIVTVRAVLTGDTTTVDYKIWNTLDVLHKDYTDTKKPCLMRLDQRGGYIDLKGWIQGYNVERNSNTQSAVTCTIQYVVKEYTWTST